MNWLRANWPYMLELTVEHLLLSIPPILISIAIAVPIGRLAFRHPLIGKPVLGAATLLYAIPALPLLILIPTLFGTQLRSSGTIIIALSIYGIALLVRTAADAFHSVDATTRDAAIATGFSARTVFWKVDLPLAIPVLLAGVRVVTVSTIGLVTIGALIGVSSLGTLLTDGFQRGIVGEVAAGVVGTVLLALILDDIVVVIGRFLTPWTRVEITAGRRRKAAA